MKRVKIEVQMFDGDGVEPPEVMRARMNRERDERAAEMIRQKASYEAKAKRRALDYKESLKTHPLFIPCVRFEADKSADHKHTRMTLTIVSTTPPESFNHIVGINRPKLTVRYPENVMRDPMQAPVQWDICNPVVTDFKYEKLPLPACQDDARTLFDPLYRYTLKMGFSKILNRSKEAYDEQRKLHASIPA